VSGNEQTEVPKKYNMNCEYNQEDQQCVALIAPRKLATVKSQLKFFIPWSNTCGHGPVRCTLCC
jgi:hypothetical protein